MAAALKAHKARAFNKASKRFTDLHNHLFALEGQAGIACFTEQAK
jgi:hypothetical protein